MHPRNWLHMPTWFQRSLRSSILIRPVSKRKKGLSSNLRLSKQRSSSPLAQEEGAAVLVALGLDVLLGEPPAAWHPVAWFGKLIQRLEQAAPQDPLPQLLYGVVMLLLAAPAAILPAALVHQLAKRARTEATQHGSPYIGLILYALIEGTGLKPFFALRMLVEAGRSVRLLLDQQDLPAARHALHSLVYYCTRPALRRQSAQSLQIWRRDARKTASPNAGHPMAAAAGALNLHLQKVGHYRLGDNEKAITTHSLRLAEQMVWIIGCVAFFLTALFKTLWSAHHG